MPPQGYVIVGGLAWNYVAAEMGKPTISMFARRHKAATVAVVVGGVAWFLPHILRTAVEAVADAIDEATP